MTGSFSTVVTGVRQVIWLKLLENSAVLHVGHVRLSKKCTTFQASFLLPLRVFAPVGLSISRITRSSTNFDEYLHCALAAAQCVVIGPVCGCGCLWVGVWASQLYHDNSKLHASILTKPGLWVKVVTISS